MQCAFSSFEFKVGKTEAKTCNLFCNTAAKRVELISDVGSFTTHESNLSYNTQVVAGCENLLQKVESNLPFATKSVRVARYTGPRQTCSATGDVTPV